MELSPFIRVLPSNYKFKVAASALVLIAVLDEHGLAKVHVQLADVLHVIADPLEIFSDKEQACRTVGRFRPADHQLDEFAEDLVVAVIDLTVAADDFA